MSKFIDDFTTNSTVLGYLAKSLGRQDSTDNALVLKYSSIVFHDKNAITAFLTGIILEQ